MISASSSTETYCDCYSTGTSAYYYYEDIVSGSNQIEYYNSLHPSKRFDWKPLQLKQGKRRSGVKKSYKEHFRNCRR